ncbi:MAG: hypothetical protein CVV02_08965 [Firmicutes bacterium HGW-Firmicutes-7]|nr:MAG: hypothetical protein CVV02_08965 [Firmicutes bacterium HGW-Firmicutes-7]
MKKLIVVIILCLIVIGIVASQSNKDENVESSYTVYLANANMNGLVPVKVSLDDVTVDTKVSNILEILREGTSDAKATIPKSVEVISIKMEEKKAVLSFNESYKSMSSIEEIICRSSVVKSLAVLQEIDTVEFYIGSVPYQNSLGKVLGAMKESDVVLDFIEDSAAQNTKKVTLYFSDEEGMHLVPVEYEVNLNAEEQIEKIVLDLLINGPEDNTLRRTIPEGTKVKNVYTNEGVCYVDFNEEFVTKHTGGSTGETMTIYSIVNSLTELNNINKVQFLIEGSVRAEYKGHIDFNALFQTNLDLIKK